jgi:micrococcal nuclease
VNALRLRWLVPVLGLFVLAAGCSSSSPRGGGGSGAGTVPVTKVTDGDTIHVTYRGNDERVRLIGVDTPEVPWYGGKGECFGVQAGLYARGRLMGRSVRLAFDVNLRDRYGRLLAYVYSGSELFNLTLVRLGYATADSVPPDTRMAAAFERAEGEARSAGRGLWSACPS